MKTRKISNNHFLIEDTARKFSADVKMNPRDSMVSAMVLLLPTENQTAILTEFETLLKDQFGGKVLLQLSPDVPQTHGEAKDMLAVKCIAPESIQRALNEFSTKPKLNTLKKLVEDQSISLFARPNQFAGSYEKLFNFKKANANFVTEAKIKNGLYSACAEEEKITKNEFAHHFAYFDNRTNEFIGCIQLFVHNNIGYLSDLIVGKNYRDQGYAQSLLSIALTKLNALVALDDHQQVEGAWLIEGAHDESDPLIPVHHRLYDELLNAQVMTAELQRHLGLRLMFGPAKELLLTASHRDLVTQESLDGKSPRANAFPAGLSLPGTLTLGFATAPARINAGLKPTENINEFKSSGPQKH